ncbi:ATP-binding protein [Desulfobacter sp.]|uniref:ATP-binding protein n=1 Tax=Desulfobacter sp. TaxID=2294 RepID=UPI00338DEAAE
MVNALIHRDSFVSAVTRIFIFDNRIEIISPGHLPNNLTIEKIRAGNSNIRIPILASFAAKKNYSLPGIGIRH